MLRKAIAVLVTVALLFGAVPLSAFASQGGYERVVDPSTMNGWTEWFGPDKLTTENAGAVWMDKSVFTDASQFPSSVTMLDDTKNFLVALSAIAANKEIVGYSTIPTDTMLVLDVSGSMDGSVDELVVAANRAIEKLLSTNKNNRIGVVLYSGSSAYGTSTYSQSTTLLLGLDRYTTTESTRVNIGTRRDPIYIEVPSYIELNDDYVSVNSTVRGASKPDQVIRSGKSVLGGTYIQSGLWRAMEEFLEADTTVDGNFQDGQKRLPIFVLMSDGAPTTATTNFANVAVSDSNVGRGSRANDASGFLNQLTASYVLSTVENHYDCKNEGLFYTLAFGTSGINDEAVAISVLDPTRSTRGINAYWETYNSLGNGSMNISAYNTNNDKTHNAAIYKNTRANNQFYVDKAFSANDSADLIAVFDEIIQQIIIQSRYYPTHLEGGTPDLSGYVEFEDKIGEYMEVKDIKGILLGNTLYSGERMASKISDFTDGGLGTVENPTALGKAFVDAAKTRLGINDSATVYALLQNAFNHGQLSYSKDGFSNYIGWYAYADGSYAGFYHEGVTTAPAGAVWANKSYAFLGETSGTINDSDMMYVSVQVHTNLATGRQSLLWKIPAALMPLVTYHVSLEGTSIANARDVELNVQTASPIRLLFEVGLVPEVNPLTVGQISDAKHVADDGVTRQFYSNYWDISAAEHIDHVTTRAGFVPSAQNERYYYIEDSVIYSAKSLNSAITDRNAVIDTNGDYYHVRYIFTAESDTAVPFFEEISPASLQKAEWDEEKGNWIIPIGTVYQEWDTYQALKSENVTDSVRYSKFLYVTKTNTSFEADANLGNNGIIYVTPATGTKISKILSAEEPGADKTFTFRVTLEDANGNPINGTFSTILTELDKSVGEEGTITFYSGVAEVLIEADQSFYITDLPDGAKYTVEEIINGGAYKLESIHLNGVAVVGSAATGTLTQYKIDDIDFVNTTIGEGNLYITKIVTHNLGSEYDIPENIKFTARVKLTNRNNPVANQTFELVRSGGVTTVTTSPDGTFDIELAAGETVAVHGLDEMTSYTVSEVAIPNGFALNAESSSGLQGVIDANVNNGAILVNNYEPESVNANVAVSVTKLITGRENWLAGESYRFTVSCVNAQQGLTKVGEIVVSAEGSKTQQVSLNGESYSAPGVYNYVITENVGAANNGVSYDTVVRRFRVNVSDVNMDGNLEIASVENVSGTVVSGNAASGYTVSAQFTNTYAPIHGSSITIPVSKTIAQNNFALNGFRFALFDPESGAMIGEPTASDVYGNASLTISFAPTMAGEKISYLLKEIPGNINGMTYDTAEYSIEVTVTDNGDGTTSASYTMKKNGVATDKASFVNSYDPQNAVIVFNGNKVLEGRVQNAGEFEFNLYRVEDNTFNLANGQLVQSVKNSYNGNFVFDELTFDTVGTYYFVINETKGNLPGVEYSDAKYNLTVTVTDNGNGVLTATSDLSGRLEFVNTYTPENVDVTLHGDKILSGRDTLDGEFEFNLYDENGNLIDTATNQQGKFTFDMMIFAAGDVGVHKFTITETAGTKGGVTYDTAVYEVTVNITDDGDGKLGASVSYEKDGNEATNVVFRNSYEAQPLNIEFSGRKSLEGREMKAGEFKFLLVNALNSNKLGEVANGADGSFNFAPVTVYTAGVYQYHISEISTNLGGVTYDTSVYDVIITVVDNGEGRLVEESRIVTKNGAEVQAITFNNVYKAAETEITVSGVKVLAGRLLEEGEFTFNLYEADSNFTFAESAAPLRVAKNAADGSVTFEPIAITEIGTRYFVAKELNEEKTGVTYDETLYNITVVTTDNGYGQLESEVTVKIGENDADLIFNNSFTPQDITVPVMVSKILRKQDPTDMGLEGFQFKLSGEAGEMLAVSNEAGKALFELNFTADDIGKTFNYTLTEVNTGVENVVYSEDEVAISITVGCTENGVLTATITQNGEATEEAVAQFVNTYDVPGHPPVPDTGVKVNLWMWIALCALSAAAALGLNLAGKKRTEN